MILLGPPGSGKGTQAKLLSERLNLVHIGTGDIIREAIRMGTPHGRQAAPYVTSGRLAPDILVNEMVNERFCRPDRPGRFIMDGYPRTIAQARAFDETLARVGLDLQAVLFMVVPDEVIIRRLSGRWSCPQCKRTYHLTNNPPKRAGICDVDQHALIQRDDDREETVRERLRQYHQNTEDLIPHYRARGLLQEVDGLGSIEVVYARILNALKRP
jgi:adenylate kinase